MFDPDWEENGHIERAVDLVEQWCTENGPAEMKIEVVRLPGRTPVILMEIEGDGEGTVLLYGHLDKQPEMSGWRDGFGPWDPILEEGRLYGRGGADDGYSAFAAVSSSQGCDYFPEGRSFWFVEVLGNCWCITEGLRT